MMTIKQLKYIIAVTDNNFNISYAADKLFTSQPGISKQIKLLEDGLGVEIFLRNGKALQGLTPIGEHLIEQARIVLTELDNFNEITKKHHDTSDTHFHIATTQTQSNYVLPDIMTLFYKKHPNIKFSIQDASFDQLVNIGKDRDADCIIYSGVENNLASDWFPKMLKIPCYQWSMLAIFSNKHPINKKKAITLKDLNQYPIVTYLKSKHLDDLLISSLLNEGLEPNIMARSNDPNLLKSYAGNNQAIAILADMTYLKDEDTGLVSYPLHDQLPKCTTVMAVERSKILKPHIYDFVKFFAPHLTHAEIETAANTDGNYLFDHKKLPSHKVSWSI